MSIENALSSIARSLEIIAAHMNTKSADPLFVLHPAATVPPVTAPLTVAAPAPAEPVAIPMPAAPAAAMPPPPVFEIPTFTSAPTVVPFADQKSMVAWVVKTYGELGQQKGMGIQKVIQGLGHASINEVKPDQYAALYAGIEALK